MDLALSRLGVPAGQAGCPTDGPTCPNDESFERLVSDLAVGVAPPISGGAASLGARGFGLSLSAAWTPIQGEHWSLGTAGPDPARTPSNPAVDGVLMWNRLEARKGLPLGLELGGAVGHGLHTSLWLLSAQLRAVLFEGFRSGLGALPDVALRGVVQQLLGSSQLSLRTYAVDVTLSKPYVIATRHRLTPLVAIQALFVDARSQPLDLTPGTSDWDACEPGVGSELRCRAPDSESDALESVRFDSVEQTRVRMFLGVEEQYAWLRCALTFGLDLTVPSMQAEDSAADVARGGLARAFTLHLAAGLRY